MSAGSFDRGLRTIGDRPCEETWLLGLPPISAWLHYVEEMATGGPHSRRALVDEWRRANDHYGVLERTEAGLADGIACTPLPRAMRPLADEVERSERYRNGFDTMPTSIEMVEMRRLVMFQNHVSRHYVEALKAELGPRPSAEALFRFCMPVGAPRAPVEIRRVGDGKFVLSSPSMDLRSHDAVMLKPEQIVGQESFGAIAGAIAMLVGFSSNMLSAVRSDGRLVLHNGYHRAVALLELGIETAPMAIETVTRRDELRLVAKRRVADDPYFYLEAARPPLLKDYADPRIRKTIPVRRVKRVVEVSIEVEDHNVPE